jgi:pyridoxal phosphate enzyme (YggS family)
MTEHTTAAAGEPPFGVAADSISVRVREVMAAVAAAAHKVGRDPSSITVVAASKTWPPTAIREAFGAGVRHFGENYADELSDKMVALRDLEDITWHFIGRVQRGNAAAIVRTSLVHGVGSVSQAQAIAKAYRKFAPNADPLAILLQVNVADEGSKNGFALGDVAAAAADIEALTSLRIMGLMAMPAVPPEALAAAFASVRMTRDAVNPHWTILSMGMSGDFETAIAEGATHVRIGTRLFGPRPTLAPRVSVNHSEGTS